MSDAKGVDAVERALSILDAFSKDLPELTLTELSTRTGLYKSTILRLAVSLEKFGYMLRGENGKFRLGPAVWRLGAQYRHSFDLAAILRPELETLSEVTQETASFYIREGDMRVCLFRCEPARAIRHTITEGARMALDRGASGKVLLAFGGTEGDRATIANGYALSLGEREAEVAALSVPIRRPDGQLVGALSVSGLITRFSETNRAQLLHALRESQSRLEAQMIS